MTNDECRSEEKGSSHSQFVIHNSQFALRHSAEIFLLEQPRFPSARLLHTLRWVVARSGLALDVWPEEEAFVAVHLAPDTLAARLVHVPHGLFPDGSELREHLRQAGVRWNYLPPVPEWTFVLDQAAFLAWLAAGTPTPRQAGGDAWLGPRRDWHGVPLAVRKVGHG